MFTQLISTISLAAAASAIATKAVPPALQGAWYRAPAPINTTDSLTDTASIVSAVKSIKPKASINGLANAAATTDNITPSTPDGYELVFGPTNGANNAPGYMGFVFLDTYDVNACAQQCNTRGADAQGGACQFFNIWRAVVGGVPTTYTCSLYYIPANVSTAVNTGQGNLQVTLSRGYKRKNFVVDGGFEGFNACSSFCFQASDANWVGTSPAGGNLDASIFFFQPYAHTGNAVALLGSADGTDALSGTLTPRVPLNTVHGKHYSIGFFQASSFGSPTDEAPAFVDVKWNGATVATIRPGFSDWQFFQFPVTGAGHDVLSFHGGAAPAWSFIDDITVFQV